MAASVVNASGKDLALATQFAPSNEKGVVKIISKRNYNFTGRLRRQVPQ